MASQYYNMQFRQRLDRALEATRVALDGAKCVKLEDASHAYSDKFAAAEVAARLGLASALSFAELLGVTDEAAAALASSAQGKDPKKLVLVLTTEGSQTYLKERTRDVVGPTVKVERQTSKSGLFGGSSTKQESTTVTTTVTEHLWTQTWRVKIRALRGDAEVATIFDKELSTVAATRTKDAPPVEAGATRRLADADWLAALPRDGSVGFAIDRADAKTRTPRRNADVDEVLGRLRELAAFARGVSLGGVACVQSATLPM